MPDQIMACSDCHTTFTFTEGEQIFFQEKGFNPPGRCPDCRRRRKAEQMPHGNAGRGGGRARR